jgi:hypothetical protein
MVAPPLPEIRAGERVGSYESLCSGSQTECDRPGAASTPWPRLASGLELLLPTPHGPSAGELIRAEAARTAARQVAPVDVSDAPKTATRTQHGVSDRSARRPFRRRPGRVGCATECGPSSPARNGHFFAGGPRRARAAPSPTGRPATGSGPPGWHRRKGGEPGAGEAPVPVGRPAVRRRGAWPRRVVFGRSADGVFGTLR